MRVPWIIRNLKSTFQSFATFSPEFPRHRIENSFNDLAFRNHLHNKLTKSFCDGETFVRDCRNSRENNPPLISVHHRIFAVIKRDCFTGELYDTCYNIHFVRCRSFTQWFLFFKRTPINFQITS